MSSCKFTGGIDIGKKGEFIGVEWCINGVSEDRCNSAGADATYQANECGNSTNKICTGEKASLITTYPDGIRATYSSPLPEVLIPKRGNLIPQAIKLGCGSSIQNADIYCSATNPLLNITCICERELYDDVKCENRSDCKNNVILNDDEEDKRNNLFCDEDTKTCKFVSYGACPALQICDDGRCVGTTPLPDQCGGNRPPCPGQNEGKSKCIDGGCFAVQGFCTARDGELPCAKGFFCDDSATKCFPGCKIDSDCKLPSNFCFNTMCIETDCVNQIDCGASEPKTFCTNRRVCAQPCGRKNDQACPDGSLCTTNQPQNICGTICDVHEDCPEQYFCNKKTTGDQGACIVGCRTNSDCAPGYSCGDDGVCGVACESDKDCSITEICAADGVCFFKPDAGSKNRLWIVWITLSAVFIAILGAIIIRLKQRHSRLTQGENMAEAQASNN